ncbi:MAG: aminotransferase class V-fold PLP-dependent enzyme [Candidatus Limnocylindrales bacterium]
MDPFLPDDTKLDAIRDLLPSLGSGIRLDVTVAGPFPAETDRAIRQSDEHQLRVGRGGPDRAEDLVQRGDEARSVVAAVLAASPDRMVLAPGRIAALSAVIVAGRVPADGCIAVIGELTAELDAAVGAVAGAHGLRVVRDPSTVPHGSSLAVAAHVDPVTGRVHDPRPLAAQAHATGAALVLDMGWSAGAIPVDAPSSGADVVLVDAHRWLLGPEGVTALWVAEASRIETVRALVDEAPRSQLLGLARSVGWLLMYVSLPWAFERSEALATRLRGALASIGGVAIEPASRGFATTLPFSVAAWSATDLAAELARRVHAHVGVDESRDLVLAGVGAWLRESEIDRFADAVAEIAAHTPETLPRRPLLTVLAPAPWDER